LPFTTCVAPDCEQGHGRVDFVTADDETHVISFEDLAFLVRAAASLPRHILEPDLMPPVVQVVTDEEKEKAEQEIRKKKEIEARKDAKLKKVVQPEPVRLVEEEETN
jgi:hypothetical protein